MLRRKFLSLIVALPFAGLFGARKPEMIFFRGIPISMRPTLND